MIQTSVYNYINVLDKAADASWLRNEAISNNIANVDTPGYKRQDVDFESQLTKALGMSRYETMDSKVAGITLSNLKPSTYTDYSGYSYRLDGNNVDIDTENVEFASNQLYYQTVLDTINHQFSMLKAAMQK